MSKMATQTWEKQSRTSKKEKNFKHWMSFSVTELNGRLIKAEERIKNL